MRPAESYINILQETFLFAGISREEVIAILTALPGTPRTYRRDEAIFTPGRFERALGIVLEGRILVTKGDGALTVSELKRGDLFGAATLFNGEETYVSTLTARTAARVLFLPLATVETLLEENPVIRMNYIRYLSGRIRFLSGRLDGMIRRMGENRLLSYLDDNAAPDGTVQLNVTMKELASRMNMSRATLYRELDRLTESGLIAREGHAIRVVR